MSLVDYIESQTISKGKMPKDNQIEAKGIILMSFSYYYLKNRDLLRCFVPTESIRNFYTMHTHGLHRISLWRTNSTETKSSSCLQSMQIDYIEYRDLHRVSSSKQSNNDRR